MQGISRRALAAAVFFAALIPYTAFLLSGLSPFETFWEFASYRYFGAMSYFEPTILPFWIVQGMPMALLQIILMAPLIGFDLDRIGALEHVELFSHASLLLAYILIGAALAFSSLSPRVLVIDAIALAVAVLALIPMARWYSYFFAPDYWIFELPIAIVSTAWGLTVLRSIVVNSPLPRYRTVVAAGAWIALCFTQKPSLAGLGAFPILFHLAMPATPIAGKIWRCGAIGLAFLATHSAIMFTLNKFHSDVTMVALRNYWNWMGTGGPSSGTSLLTFHNLLIASGYLWVPIAVGTVVMIAGSVAGFLDGQRRKAVIAGAILAAVLTGHVIVIRSRPSGTSVVDLAIYGACLIPLGLAIGRLTYRRYIAAAVLVVAAIIFPRPVLLPPSQPPSGRIIARLTEAATYVRSLGRPVRVVVHDNRAHPLTIEALALYTGQLPPVAGGSSWLRERFLANTQLLHDPGDLLPAIMRGDVIIWGSAPGAPLAELQYPELSLLTDEEHSVLRVIEIEPQSHTANIGYLTSQGLRP
jgi:hypothetical protein